jgi:hypothetical protein
MLEHLRAKEKIKIDITAILADHPHHVTFTATQYYTAKK